MLACDNGAAGVAVGSGYTVKFARSDDRRSPTVGFDWAPNLFKGECDNSHAITAIATDQVSHDSHSGLCNIGIGDYTTAVGVLGARCSALTSPPGFVTQAQFCQALDFGAGDARETTSSGDWDPGFFKGECGPGRFIKGIAHGGVGDGSGQAVRILCCSPGYVRTGS
jgi:hypothetical protein